MDSSPLTISWTRHEQIHPPWGIQCQLQDITSRMDETNGNVQMLRRSPDRNTSARRSLESTRDRPCRSPHSLRVRSLLAPDMINSNQGPPDAQAHGNERNHL